MHLCFALLLASISFPFNIMEGEGQRSGINSIVPNQFTEVGPVSTSEASAIVQNIEVKGTRGEYVITGEGRPLSGTFYYTVEDGHNEFLAESIVKMDNNYPKWSRFKIEIHIPEQKLPQNASFILHLYERSNKHSIIHSNPILLERL